MATSGPSTPTRSTSYSSVPAPAPTSRNNPISLRIYKAIGTSFDDPASRQALEIASGLYSGKGKAKEIDHGEYDVVDGEDEADDIAVRRAGKGESAAMARKWLKRDIEGRMASSSQKFLEAFGEVDKVCLGGWVSSVADAKKLDVLREHMQEMQVRCDQVQSELDQANSGTKYLLERADGLRSQRSVFADPT